MKDMVMAYPLSDGRFELRDGQSIMARTYHMRERIKRAGGEWDADRKRWIVPAEAVAELPVDQMVMCRVAAYCHMPEDTIWVPFSQYESGRARRGCPMCDTSYFCGGDVEILEVVRLTEARA